MFGSQFFVINVSLLLKVEAVASTFIFNKSVGLGVCARDSGPS